MSKLKTLVAFASLSAFVGCTTSLDVAGKGGAPRSASKRRANAPSYEDPTGVKTVDAPDGAKVESASAEALQRQVAILQGELEDAKVQGKLIEEQMQARVRALELEKTQLIAELEKARTQAPAPALLPETGPKGAEALWELGLADVKAGRFEAALGPFGEITKSYGKDPRHPFAILGVGFAHYRLKQFKDAAVVFNQFIDKHPKHPSASLAWFGGGASLSQLGQADDAKLFFDEVVKRYPKSAEAREAKVLLAAKRKKPAADLFALFPAWTKGAPKSAVPAGR